MSFGAIAGAITGAGEGIRDNRDAALRRDEYDIRREDADRQADLYNREKAFRDIMDSRPDPIKVAQQVAQGPQEALPQGQQGPPAASPPKYRDQYRQWRGSAEQLALKAGGLEGLTKFQDMDNALGRRMVLGYGLDAIRELDNGNVGAAVKAANTALEVTPTDTGMKFIARNGEVWMEGPEGDLGGPYNADALRGFVEDNMKTPEAYLDWMKQGEVTRGAKAREGIATTQAAAYSKSVDTAASKADSEILLNKANAYRALALGRAALAGGAEDTGVSDSRINNIEKMEEEAMKGGLGFGGPWMTELGKDSQTFNATVGAAKMIRLMNIQDKFTNNHATEIARMAYFNDLPESQKAYPRNLQDVTVQEKNGAFQLLYQGMEVLVPPPVAVRILQNQALPVPEGALPTSARMEGG